MSLQESGDHSFVFAIPFKPENLGTAFYSSSKRLYKNTLFSDIKIIWVHNGQERIIDAHRVLLYACSPFLRELLKKVESDSLILPELEPEFKTGTDFYGLLLQFVYQGKCKVPHVDLLLMLKLSHKFGVDPLKEQCGARLFEVEETSPSTSSEKDVGFLLDIAIQYGCSLLESKCAEFLADKFQELADTKKLSTRKRESWLLEKNPSGLYLMPVSTWREVLKKDQVQATETEIFLSVVKFANLQKTNKERLHVLSELLPYIRYVYLAPKFIVSEVEPLSEEVPALNQYLFEAYRHKVAPPEYRVLTDRTRSRKGGVCVFNNDKRSSGIKLEDDLRRLVHVGTSNTWQSAMSEEVYSDGYHEFHFKIHKDVTHWIFIGVAPPSWNGFATNQYVGQDLNSWSYGAYQGWSRVNQGNRTASSYSAQTYTTGDTISLKLDMSSKTISFGKNGTDFGQAFANLPNEVSVVVTLYGTGDDVEVVSSPYN